MPASLHAASAYMEICVCARAGEAGRATKELALAGLVGLSRAAPGGVISLGTSLNSPGFVRLRLRLVRLSPPAFAFETWKPNQRAPNAGLLIRTQRVDHVEIPQQPDSYLSLR